MSAGPRSNPGNDWAAQVLQSLFPMSRRRQRAVDRQRSHRHRPDRRSVHRLRRRHRLRLRLLQHHHEHPPRRRELARSSASAKTWMFVVRVGFAGIMMFPLGDGFSAGQGLVYQSAMWGIGMAKVLYTNAIQAVGPDAVVIAQPMVPGTEQVILGLIDNELCADLVNLASQYRQHGSTAHADDRHLPQRRRLLHLQLRTLRRQPVRHASLRHRHDPDAGGQPGHRSPDSRSIWRRSSRPRSATF